MKLKSTLFLKFVTVLFALAILVLCVFVLPAGILSDKTGMYKPILVGMLFPAIPFFIGIFHVLKLLKYIDTNQAFSELSVKSLDVIKYCGFSISAMYAMGMPYIFIVAASDDAPGVALLGLIFMFTPLIIGVLAALFKNQLHRAISIKVENDQTI